MPGCETFARSLGRPLPNGAPGPPVLRSFSEPYGMQAMRGDPRLAEKLDVANECHFLSISIVGWVVFWGGLALYEQPAPWEGTVTVFDWPEFEELQRTAQGTLYRTNQGYFGAASIKPTALWASFLLYHCISQSKEGGALPQLLPDGSFGTNPAKAYPPAFSRAIVKDITAAWKKKSKAQAIRRVYFFLVV